MASKNPKDLVKEFKTVNGTVTTLIVKPELFPAWAGDDDQPYRVYDKSFSRLVVTIIRKPAGGGKLVVNANIPVWDLAGICKAAENASMMGTVISSSTFKWAMDMLKKASEPETPASVNDGQNSRREENKKKAIQRASEIKIANGKLKGKTPYQALLEGETGTLANQIDWLEESSRKNPKYKKTNDVQVNAIKAALYLANNNLLSEEEKKTVQHECCPAQDTFVLLPATPKGDSRHPDENGYCKCYEIEILWHIGDRYPVEIKIGNYEAPIRKDASGRQNVIKSERKKNEKGEYADRNFSFRLDETSFWNDVRMIKVHMSRFEQLYAFNQFRDADACDEENRRRAAEEKAKREAEKARREAGMNPGGMRMARG